MDMLAEALIQGLFIGAVYALITLGLTVVQSVSGVLNFAHGHFVVAAMYLGIVADRAFGFDPYIAVFAIVPVMFLAGIALYHLVFRRLAGTHVLMAVQVTLGLSFLIEGVTLMSAGGDFKRVHSFVEGKNWDIGPVTVEAVDLVAFAVALVTSAVLFLVIARTSYGRSMRSVLQNPRGAQLVGVNIHRVRLLTFGLGVALAALAGLLLLPGTSVQPNGGLALTVTAILAFFIGGPGNLLGTFLGALLLGVAESIGVIYLPGAYGFTLPYIVVIVVIMARPQGLFALKAAVR